MADTARVLRSTCFELVARFAVCPLWWLALFVDARAAAAFGSLQITGERIFNI